MRIHFVSSMVMGPRISSFHCAMFHGVCSRSGDPYGPAGWPGIPSDAPLDLCVNAFELAEVIQPRINFIVSERVMRSLRGLPGVDFEPVVLSKVINVPYHKGDFTFYDDPHAFFAQWPNKFGAQLSDEEELNALVQDPESLYSVLDGDSNAMARIPRYFEVLSWHLENVPDNPLPSLDVKSVLPRLDEVSTKKIIKERLPRQVCESCAILHASNGAILSEDAFGIMSDFLDRDFYAVGSFEI